MLSKKQIKLVSMAARAAGLRGGKFSNDNRYYLLLGQYTQPNGHPVTSCKQLTRDNLEDFLGICESLGWQHPKHGPNHYQNKKRWYSNDITNGVSDAQAECIRKLAGDLGMHEENLKKFFVRMTENNIDNFACMSNTQAWKITEALKAMLSRKDGVDYKTIADVKSAYC